MPDRRHPHSGRNVLWLRESDGAMTLRKESGTSAINEAWLYGTLGGHIAAVTSPISSDTERAVVVLRYHDGASSLHDVEHPIEFLFHYAQLAMVLAELHHQPVPNDAPTSPNLPRLRPAPYGIVETLGPGARELLTGCQSMPGLLVADELAASVDGPTAIVHGDLKPDNVLLVDGWPVIIDWDLAGRGVIWTDLGAIVGSMIDSYATTIRHNEAGELAASVPIELIHGACESVLTDYWGDRRRPADSRRLAYSHAALWMAWRVIIEASSARKPSGVHRARLVLADWVAREMAEWGVRAA